MNKILFAVVTLMLAGATVALVMQNQTQTRLRAENDSLRQQREQLNQLQADNENLSNRLARATAAADAQTAELIQLRSEVASFSRQIGQMTGLQRKNQQLSEALARRAAPLSQPPPTMTPPAAPPANAAPDAAAGPDLGPVQLVNQTPSRFYLGGGKTCTLTPTIDADGNYDIKVVIEVPNANGQATSLTTGRIVTAPGHPVRLNVGDNSIAFTPTVYPVPYERY